MPDSINSNGDLDLDLDHGTLKHELEYKYMKFAENLFRNVVAQVMIKSEYTYR